MNRRPIYEYPCDERPKTKSVGSTLLTYHGLPTGLEHLKIDTSLIDERFVVVLTRVSPTLDLIYEESNPPRKLN